MKSVIFKKCYCRTPDCVLGYFWTDQGLWIGFISPLRTLRVEIKVVLFTVIIYIIKNFNIDA